MWCSCFTIFPNLLHLLVQSFLIGCDGQAVWISQGCIKLCRNKLKVHNFPIHSFIQCESGRICVMASTALLDYCKFVIQNQTQAIDCIYCRHLEAIVEICCSASHHGGTILLHALKCCNISYSAPWWHHIAR